MLYQGVLIVKKEVSRDACPIGQDEIYIEPTKIGEYKEHIKKGFLPDGRKILCSRLLDNPVREESLSDIVFELMLKGTFGE